MGEEAEGEVPGGFLASGARPAAVPFRKTAKALAGAWPNMVALGFIGELIGLPAEAVRSAAREALKKVDAVEGTLAAVAAGVTMATALGVRFALPPAPPRAGARWLVSGNEAAGFGAIRGGVRFVAAYPITPATEMLEWMAPALARVGGSLVQAEDELASVNMIVGASYGGVPSLTATAGPGLALMTEGIGLAVAAEVPIVVVDVMRGGPSTGIPAKSEQSDLAFATSGLHGDAPRLVLAPTSIGDCVGTTQWAVELAEALQAPAIVLSDQFMGQSRAVVDRPAGDASAPQRLTAPAGSPDYRRYRDTPSGVSPMAVPGTVGTAYTADGLEHTEAGLPSSNASDHYRQLDKRARKLVQHDYGPAGPMSRATATLRSSRSGLRRSPCARPSRGCARRACA